MGLYICSNCYYCIPNTANVKLLKLIAITAYCQIATKKDQAQIRDRDILWIDVFYGYKLLILVLI